MTSSRAEGFDLAATPQRRRTLAREKVGDEVVLCVPETGRTHYLNSAATAVWTCLDGSTTLRELAADIAAVSEWDRAGVEADLIEVVRDFGRRRLLADTEPESQPAAAPAAPSEASPRLIRVPPGACTMRTDLDWEETRAVRVGRYLLGVRSGSPELDRLVGRVLDDHLVPDGEAPPNYSLRLASTDGVRQHRLFHNCETSVRTRSLQRLLRAVAAFLAGHADEQDTTVVHVEALVLTWGGVAFVLPPELRPLLPTEEALLGRGLRLLDAPTAALDPASGELVVRPPRFPLDEAAVAEAADLQAEPGEVVPTVPPGHYPVRGLVHLAVTGQPHAPSRAAVVARTNRRVRNRAAIGAQTALSVLARVVDETGPFVVPAGQPTGATLDTLIEQHRR